MNETLPSQIMPANTRNKTNKTKVVEVPQVDTIGRQQPQNLEMEAAVIGALMVEQDAYGMISEILRPDSFYDKRHRLIYEAVQSLSLQQKPVDLMTVTEQMESLGTIEDAGGPLYLTMLADRVTSSAHIVYHAKIIQQKFLARQLITLASVIQTKAFDPTEDVQDLLNETEGKLFEVSQNTMKKSAEQINPFVTEVVQLIQKAASRTDGMSGLSSGFEGIDKMTSGWQNSDLIIIAARPAMGKTAFVLSMIKKMACDLHTPVAMFSLEMSNVQLVRRLMGNVCEISGEKLRNGQLDNHEWAQLDARVNALIDAPVYLDDTSALSIFELRTKARRLVREHNVGMIMIDYLQLMTASGAYFSNRQEEVSLISRSLKALAKELNIPIIALSQLNRGVEKREGDEGKRPQLSDLRESGAIEQDADIVCFIHRPEYYGLSQDEQNRDTRGMAEFIIAKHRNGATGIVKMKFRHEFARFEDMHETSYVPMPKIESISSSSPAGEFPPVSINDDPFGPPTEIPVF